MISPIHAPLYSYSLFVQQFTHANCFSQTVAPGYPIVEAGATPFHQSCTHHQNFCLPITFSLLFLSPHAVFIHSFIHSTRSPLIFTASLTLNAPEAVREEECQQKLCDSTSFGSPNVDIHLFEFRDDAVARRLTALSQSHHILTAPRSSFPLPFLLFSLLDEEEDSKQFTR